MRMGNVAWFVCAGMAWGQKGPSIEETRDHWAFQPIVQTNPPPVEGVRNPIDSFVRAKLTENNLSPSPEASRATLIRRIFFDLTGIPPTFEEVREFEKDVRPDAYGHLVDKLLSSPRFGERWGRHWLDLARYADTKGYLVGGASRRYPFAYAYRDWVVSSLNAGMPFDGFVRKQLAADLLLNAPNDPDLAALGFLTVGPRFLNRRHMIIDDRIDVVTRGLMGFTVGCARCHDHFYDPVPQEDYYSLYGIFDSTKEPKELPVIGRPDPSAPQYKDFEVKLRSLEKAVDDHLRSKWNYVRSEDGLRVYLQTAHDGYNLSNDRLDALAAKRKLFPKLVIRWRAFLQNKEKSKDRLFATWRAFQQAEPQSYQEISTTLLSSGSHTPAFLAQNLKKELPKSFTEVVSWYAREFADALSKVQDGGERKGVMTFVASPAFPVGFGFHDVERYFDTKSRNKTNSLRAKISKHHAEHPGSPARAMSLVEDASSPNPRIFQRGNPDSPGREVPRRFLAALSRKPQRKPYREGSGRLELAQSILHPSNPLTARVFVNRVWKHLLGEGIVRTPSDFGLRGEPPTHPLLLDHLASRFVDEGWDVKSLIRHIMTSATYRQASSSGPSGDVENRLLSVMNRRRLDFEAMWDGMLTVSGELDLTMGGRSVDLTKKPSPRRRAVYGYVERQNLPTLLRTFDFANPNIHSAARPETTVPQQALFALNDPFVIARAEALARQAQHPSNDSTGALAISLYRRILAREPSAEELATAITFLTETSEGNLVDFAQALLVSNEFFFVD